MITISDTDRKAAWRFLKDLEQHLGRTIEPALVREFIRESKGSNYEFDFVNKFMLPTISDYLRQNLSPADAVTAFLTESVEATKKQGIASGTPASAHRHLFTKVLGESAKSLVEMWWGTGKKKSNLLSRSCPDWAFRKPCQHTVVFECKLFRKGGLDAAKTELVKSIYQCFHYLGQPKVPPSETHAAWDYDYACLVAYDASGSRSLVEEWKCVDPKVEKECWNASNIFVMVLSAPS